MSRTGAVSAPSITNTSSAGSLAFASHLAAVAHPEEPVAVCGDFNIAPEDRDVWDPAAFVGSTHVTA